MDFDVCYDTEDEPLLNIWAYDGLFLRVTDLTGGTHVLRSVLVEAFQDRFRTDGFFGYPKHFPRNSDPDYFEDMAVWAGASGGFQHVHLRLPGMAGTIAQLRFEYAQDEFGSCADVRPGPLLRSHRGQRQGAVGEVGPEAALSRAPDRGG